jgi:hypothetical protein
MLVSASIAGVYSRQPASALTCGTTLLNSARHEVALAGLELEGGEDVNHADSGDAVKG